MGLIFDIQKFCIHDGPGIRTVVFLKGCPLHCTWCHNPESKSAKPELLRTAHTCIGCGACAQACPTEAIDAADPHNINRALCNACGACASVCPTQSLALAGREMSPAEILAEVLRDRPFYEASGGGLTISGGEALLQSDFTLALLQGAKAHGLHTCVETCGFADTDKLLGLVPWTDLFLYDWKCTDDALHRAHTGVGNRRIRDNLYVLNTQGADVILRCPIIPEVNDNETHFAGIAALANALPCIRAVEIEPYHPLGTGKAERLGVSPRAFPVPTHAQTEHWLECLRPKIGIPVRKA